MSGAPEKLPGTLQPKPVWTGTAIVALVLALHAASALVRHERGLVWDEGRYVECALHLLGRTVDTFDPADFVNGPGYPLVLAPFIAAMPDLDESINEGWLPDSPVALLPRLLNAVLLAGAAGFLWLSLRRYAGWRWAGIGALWLGLHPLLLWSSLAMMSEPLALFCLAGFMWAFCRALTVEKRTGLWLAAAALFLGWLTLTRVIFGHVLLVMTALCLIIWPLIPAWRASLSRALIVLAGAWLVCAPYLWHTWKVTGQFPCWSTNSGELLYWLTSHHPGENGHWFSHEDAQNEAYLAPRHGAFYERVLQLPVAEREAAFKAQARAQFEPRAFAYNWTCNLSRLVFGFPRSFQMEELRMVLLVLFHGPLLVFVATGGLLALRHWRDFPVQLWLLAALATVYLAGSTLAPALPRYFVLVSPLLLLTGAASWRRFARCELRQVARI